MNIVKNTVVSLDYKLTEKDKNGELIEQTHGSEPLKFIFGIGQMIPAFEENIEGKKSGDEVDFGIVAEDAYGLFEDEAVMDFDIQQFAVDGKVDRDKLQVGKRITMQDNQGNAYHGNITEIGIDKIKVDFNHPMAGIDLFFSVKINDVREATSSELDHGHVH